MEKETAVSRSSLKVAYEVHMEKVQPLLDKLDGYWTMYENYIALSNEASEKFTYYDAQVVAALNSSNTYKVNAEAEIDNRDDPHRPYVVVAAAPRR